VSDGSDGPLARLRVLEVAGNMAAPFAGCVLRDFGADVVKIEEPQKGDNARSWTPIKEGHSLPFARLNFNKKSVVADLHTEHGQRLVKLLAQRADVVITAFRPTALESWALRYRDLVAANPSVVVANVTGYGLTGPYRNRPGFGSTADAVSGFANINGWPETPPTLAHFGLADLTAGLATAIGIMMALFRRSQTGEGDEVDVALYEPLMVLVGDIILNYTTTGVIRKRSGNSQRTSSPVGVYQASDGGWLTVSGSGQGIVGRLFQVIGHPEAIQDPRYSTNEARVAHDADLQRWITDWVAGRTRADALAMLTDNGIVAGPVNTAADIVMDPHFLERTLVRVKSTLLGEALMPGAVAHLRSFAGLSYTDPPALGEHTAAVLREWLDVSEEEIGVLARG